MARAGEHTRRKRQHWRETSNDSRAVRWREFREERERRQSEEEERYATELNRRAEERSRNEEQKRLDSLRQKKAEEERLRTQQAEEEKRYIAELNRRAEERRQQEERKQAEAIRRQQEETEALRKKYTSSSTRTGTVTGYVLTSDYSPSSVAPQKFDTSFSRLKKGLSSSVTESDFLGVTDKRNLPDGGIQQTVLIKDSAVANKSLERAETGIATDISLHNQLPDGAEPFQKFKGVTYAGQEAFFGKKAKKAFEQLIKAQMGGKVDWDGDVAHYEYALGEDFVKEQEKKGLNPAGVFETKAFAKARAQSSKVDEEDKKERENKKAKDSVAHRRRTLGAILKVVATVTALADIARRILTAVLSRAVQARQDTVLAHNLGTTYQQAQFYGVFEKAHGLKQGTVMGALQDIQSKFGNITDLDEKALEGLARVMGSEIRSLVQSGMGGEEPEKLMEKILDKYFSSYKAGKNSLGQNVGSEQARRELVSALNRISPNLASMLALMIEDSRSGLWRDKFDTVAGWLATTRGHRLDVTDVDMGAFQALGSVVTSAGAEFKKFIDDAGALFASDLIEVIGELKQTRLLMGAEEREKANLEAIENREKVLLNLTDMRESSRQTIDEALKTNPALAEYADMDLAYVKSHPFEPKVQELKRRLPYMDSQVAMAWATNQYSEQEIAEINQQIADTKLGEDIKFNYDAYLPEVMKQRIQEKYKNLVGMSSNSRLITSYSPTSVQAILKNMLGDEGLMLDELQKEYPEVYAFVDEAYREFTARPDYGAMFTEEGINPKYSNTAFSSFGLLPALKYYNEHTSGEKIPTTVFGKGYNKKTEAFVKDIFIRRILAQKEIESALDRGDDKTVAYWKEHKDYKDYELLMEAQRRGFLTEAVTGGKQGNFVVPFEFGTGKAVGGILFANLMERLIEQGAFDITTATELTSLEAVKSKLTGKLDTKGVPISAKDLVRADVIDWVASQNAKTSIVNVSCTFIDSEGKKRTGNIEVPLSAGASVKANASGTLRAVGQFDQRINYNNWGD